MENVYVGEVVKPQGIKGEVKIKLYDIDFSIENIDSFVLDGKEFAVEGARKSGEFLYIKFFGVDNAIEAEHMRGKIVNLTEENAKSILKQNQYFVDHILGFDVFLDNGKILGKLADVQNFGSADVYYIDALDGKQILFPLVDDIIESISTEEHRIVLNSKKYEEVGVKCE